MTERRTSHELTFSLIEALVAHRQWTQAELARHMRVDTDTLRRLLARVEPAGVHVERDGRDVHINVPANWLAGRAVNLGRDDVALLAAIVLRTPRSAARDALLTKLLAPLPDVRRRIDVDVVESGEAPQGHDHFGTLVAAASANTALTLDYTKGADVEVRVISPQRLHNLHGIAYCQLVCHRTDALRWFRVERVLRVRASTEPYRRVSAAKLDEDAKARVRAFRTASAPRRLAFYADPEVVPWLRDELPEHTSYDPTETDVRVELESAGVSELARIVVGLGARARPETHELVEAVRALALGALGALPEED